MPASCGAASRAVKQVSKPRPFVAAPAALLQRLRQRRTYLESYIAAPAAPGAGTGAGEGQTVVPPLRARATAAAAASSPGVQSSASVRAASLVGFTALDMTRRQAEIGVVEKVLTMAETGQAQPLLLVVATPGDEEAAAGAMREEHLVPYVQQIVPSIDLEAGLVFVQPPTGLLELGRQRQLLARLKRDLEPFTHPEPLSVAQRLGLRVMPSPAQLAAAGREDLVAAVRRAGGFPVVAQELGLRSQRKPAGFWDDEMNLDEELTLFVAAHWAKFKDPDSRGSSYWYNQITHRISWEPPVLPQRIEIDDEGGFIVTEAEEDRVMPSRSALAAAGRYDLHHAIIAHGGYTAAAQALDRRPAWPPSQHLDSLTALRQELREFVDETALPRNKLPTASQLLDAGRGDLYQAIARRGGFAAAAEALGWATQRRRRSEWQDAGVVAAELRRFILGGGQAHEAQGHQRRGGGHDLDERQEPLPPSARMPTHRQLASAGRHDLKYALQRHGSAKIADMLGIRLDERGAHKRRRPPATDE